jgi:hypothetical protein
MNSSVSHIYPILRNERFYEKDAIGVALYELGLHCSLVITMVNFTCTTMPCKGMYF